MILLMIISTISRSFLLILLAAATMTTSAQAAAPVVSLNKAYAKGNGNYDIVVKESVSNKLCLYVNDAQRACASPNKKGWATFKRVPLAGTGKLTFAQYQNTALQPINYTRYYKVNTDNKTVAIAARDFTKKASAPAKTTVTQSTVTAPVPTPAPRVTPAPAPQPAPTPEPVCANGSYVNSAGNRVCSPASTPSAPAGASARCVDGSYSFSQSRRGTCSYHGGVSAWL